MTFAPDGDFSGADQAMPTCTVVVCTRNRPVQLDRCLEALAKLTYPSFIVLVVDNAPCDMSAREIAVRWGACYIVEPVRGLSRARNLGVRACSTDIVAFLDDDSIPESDWLFHLVAEFKDPQVMAATGRIVPSKIETEAERLCALLNGSTPFGLERQVVNRYTPCWFEIASFGGIGDGGNMAFRREAFDVWRGFDEVLGRGTLLCGGEEHHAFFSLIHRGFRVVYTPDAVVSHPCPVTMQDLHSRHLSDLAAATAYITFLFVKERQYRWAILKYLFEALQGTPRAWRGQVPRPRPRIVSRWRKLLAYLLGPLLYMVSRFAHKPKLNYSVRVPEKLSPLGFNPTTGVSGSSQVPKPTTTEFFQPR